MTAQKLYETLKFLDELDKSLGLHRSLVSVRDALVALVGAPAQPQLQSTLATAIEGFASAAAKLGGGITPSQAALIADMGGRNSSILSSLMP